MIVDMHRHMWSVEERHRAAFAELPGRDLPPSTNFDWEETTQEIVEEMDGAGVDRSVLLVADFAARLGDAPFGIEEENRLTLQAHRRYPERLVAFYGIDPRRPGAADCYERAIKEWGVRGLKLHSSVGFFPHDRVCYPIYELSVAHGLPVLFHVGPVFHPRLYSRFCHPLEFDQVAADFPNMTMILGHAGNEWWADCVALGRGHPNMVLELSEWQPVLRDNPQEALHAIDRMRNVLGIDRIVWGTDFPVTRRHMSLKECVEIFQRLPSLREQHGYTFSGGDVDAMLGGNATSILKLA